MLVVISKSKPEINFLVAFLVAVLADGIDFPALVGALPIVGDVFDGIVIMILFVLIGPFALLNVIEFVPGLDFIPVYTASTLSLWYMKAKDGYPQPSGN